jgi:hypothetical protein
VQATQLLQARKSEEDVAGICEMCDKLRVSQIIKECCNLVPFPRVETHPVVMIALEDPLS